MSDKVLHDPSDDEIVRRVLKGEREAYRVLVERYQERLFFHALDMLRNREDAEDVVQESFVKGYLALKSFRSQSSFYTWMYRIVSNMAIDLRRRKNRRSEQTLDGPGELAINEENARETMGAPAAEPEEALLQAEQAKLFKQGLHEMSEEHRQVLMLREVDGLSYDEIARSVGVSRGTVMSRLHYARKRLQRVLKDFAGGDGAFLRRDGKIEAP